MTDLEKAIEAITKKRAKLQSFINYYEGEHQLTFATSKFKNTFGAVLKTLKANLCPLVVEAQTDRMEIINFSENAPAATKRFTERGVNREGLDLTAWDLWTRNSMEIVSNNVHREAVKTGEAYLIVWQDSETGKAAFYEQDSRSCAVIEDAETGKPLFGAKLWRNDEKKLRVTLYYADRIEKYISIDTFQSEANEIDVSHTKLTQERFEGFNENGEKELELNPFFRIPIFKFTTFPILSDCIPIQDALNKTIADKLIAMEFQAYPQRWATGLELPTNEETGEQYMPFKAGSDRLWFTDGESVEFGQFAAADLTQFISVAEFYQQLLARISGTPVHFFSMALPERTSGEALKTLESRFTKRIKRTCLNFSPGWAGVMQFALEIENTSANNLSVQWDSPEQRSEMEFLDTLGRKKEVLQVPVRTLQEEYGYSVADIEKFEKAAEEEAETEMDEANQAQTPSQNGNSNGIPR